MEYGVGKVNKICLKQKANIRNNLVRKTKIKSVKNKTKQQKPQQLTTETKTYSLRRRGL